MKAISRLAPTLAAAAALTLAATPSHASAQSVTDATRASAGASGLPERNALGMVNLSGCVVRAELRGGEEAGEAGFGLVDGFAGAQGIGEAGGEGGGAIGRGVAGEHGLAVAGGFEGEEVAGAEGAELGAVVVVAGLAGVDLEFALDGAAGGVGGAGEVGAGGGEAFGGALGCLSHG